MSNLPKLDDEELRHDLEDMPAADLVRDPLFRARVCLPNRRQIKGFVEAIDIVRATSERLYRVRYNDGHLQHFTAAEIKVMQDLIDTMDPKTNLAGAGKNNYVHRSHPSQAHKWPATLFKRPAKKEQSKDNAEVPKSRSGQRRPKDDAEVPKSRSGQRRPKDNAEVPKSRSGRRRPNDNTEVPKSRSGRRRPKDNAEVPKSRCGRRWPKDNAEVPKSWSGRRRPKVNPEVPKSRSGRRRPTSASVAQMHAATQKRPRSLGMDSVTVKCELMEAAAKRGRTASAKRADPKAQKKRSGKSGCSGKSGWLQWKTQNKEERQKEAAASKLKGTAGNKKKQILKRV